MQCPAKQEYMTRASVFMIYNGSEFVVFRLY